MKQERKRYKLIISFIAVFMLISLASRGMSAFAAGDESSTLIN